MQTSNYKFLRIAHPADRLPKILQIYIAISQSDLGSVPPRQLVTCQTMNKSSFHFNTMSARQRLSSSICAKQNTAMIMHIADSTSMPPKSISKSLCSSFMKAISVNEEHVQICTITLEKILSKTQGSNLKVSSSIKCTKARATASPDLLQKAVYVLKTIN